MNALQIFLIVAALVVLISIRYLEDQRLPFGEYYALLTGHTSGAWDAMAAVLWQSTLWSLAAEVDARETAVRLGRWWQAPRRTRQGR